MCICEFGLRQMYVKAGCEVDLCNERGVPACVDDAAH